MDPRPLCSGGLLCLDDVEYIDDQWLWKTCFIDISTMGQIEGKGGVPTFAIQRQSTAVAYVAPRVSIL